MTINHRPLFNQAVKFIGLCVTKFLLKSINIMDPSTFVATQQKRLVEALLLSTHNIMFSWRNKGSEEKITWYPL